MMENNIRFRQIGRLENLPEPVLEEAAITLEETRNNTGLTLVLALNYGSRAEISDAMRAIAEEVREGRLRPDQITEETISNHLYTAGMPDPDLLIRTAEGNAREQLPALADQLCRAICESGAMARLWGGRSSCRDLLVCIAQSAVWGVGSDQHA